MQLMINREARQVSVGGVALTAEPRLYDLLTFLGDHAGQVVEKDQLLEAVWDGRVVSDAAISQAIAKLRRLLRDAGVEDDLITTVHGHGYRWDGPVPSAPQEPALPATGQAIEQPADKPRRASTGRWRWVAIAAVLIAGLTISLQPERAGNSATLAVAPLAIAGEGELDWAELGLASLLGDAIASRTSLKVISPSRVRSSLRSRGIAIDAPAADQLIALRELVGADHLLLAQVTRLGGEYQLQYRLAGVDAAALEGQVSAPRIDGLAEKLGASVAGDLDVAYEAGIPLKKISSDDFVNEAFARGMQALLSGDAEQARSFFASALASDPGMSWARYELGNAFSQLGDWEQSREAFQQALDEARDSGDLNLSGAAASGLGVLAWRNGDPALAESFLLQARDWFDQVGNDANLASALGNLGILAENQGRLDEARTLYQRTLTLYRSEKERFGESVVYSNLASLERKRGQLSEAENWQRRAVELQEGAGLRQLLVYSYNHMGKITFALGRWDESEQWLLKAQDLTAELKDRWGGAEARSVRAEQLIVRGRLDEASALLNEALPVYEDLNNPAGEAAARLLLARIADLRGDFQAAWSEADQALALYRDLGDVRMQVAALVTRGSAGDPQPEDLAEALSLAQELGDEATLARVQMTRAQAGGQPELFETAHAHALNSGDRRMQALTAIDLAQHLLETGALEGERLQTLLGQVESWQPRYHGALFLKARVAEHEGELARARALYEAARDAAGEAWQADQEARLQSLLART